jgi:hypothetical protein
MGLSRPQLVVSGLFLHDGNQTLGRLRD